MTRKDGGPAFPIQDPQAIHAYAQAATEAAKHDNVDHRDQTYLAARAEAIGGMSLRDYFAAKAMQGICSHQDTWGLGNTAITEQAYKIADNMLAERAK